MFQRCTRVLRDNKCNHSTVENATENKTKSIIRIVEAGIVDIRYGIIDPMALQYHVKSLPLGEYASSSVFFFYHIVFAFFVFVRRHEMYAREPY